MVLNRMEDYENIIGLTKISMTNLFIHFSSRNGLSNSYLALLKVFIQILTHLVKHGWFYAEIIGLIGAATLKTMQL